MAKQQKKPYSFLTQERLDEMRHLKWSDKKIANYLFLVQTEGGPKEEDMTYRTAERVATVFQKNKFFAGLTYPQMVEKAKQHGLLNNPQAIGRTFYNNRMGNKSGDDGYKFRGRGFAQLTGRETYEKVGKALGIDIVSNPDIVAEEEWLGWVTGLEYVSQNDKTNKLGNTLEGMHSIIRPAIKLEKLKEKGISVLTTEQLNAIAKANSLSKSIEKLNQQPAPTKAKPLPEPNPQPKNRGSGSIMTPFDDDLRSGRISIGTWFEKNQQQIPPSETV
jgi:predicted chitinase